MQDTSFCQRYTTVPSVSKERITECFNRGFSIEDKFIRIVKSLGHDCFKCSVDDDFRHIDVKILVKKDPKRPITVDIKAKRKVRSCDTSVSETKTYLELANVQGNDGSVMGSQDVMAFEYGKDSFIIVPTESLRTMLKEKMGKDYIEKKEYGKKYSVKYPQTIPETYKAYGRDGRKDRIVLVELSDIAKYGKILTYR